MQVAKSIDPARFESVVWVTRVIEHSRNRMLQAELNDAGIPLHVLERKSRNDLLAWRRFASFIRRRRTDVIHAHGFGSNFWSTVVGRAAGAPWSSRTSIPGRSRANRSAVFSTAR